MLKDSDQVSFVGVQLFLGVFYYKGKIFDTPYYYPYSQETDLIHRFSLHHQWYDFEIDLTSGADEDFKFCISLGRYLLSNNSDIYLTSFVKYNYYKIFITIILLEYLKWRAK